MAEPTRQPRPSTAAPQDASTKHTCLRTAALAFIAAQTHNPSLQDGMDTPALRRLVTPSYTHSFGPEYFVALTPSLQHTFSIDDFIAHTQRMTPALEKWEVGVEGVVVDEVGEEVVVRCGYVMWVKGEGVRNEVAWWLEMEETGEGWRVRRSREVVDGVAAGRIRELLLGVVGKGSEVVSRVDA
ncbi:hypothetical protein B5807_07444 [Epicoccum nigrum]|uniref:SnoaL-like domain-containing protein n=1 Tax=Epicoccum nigrum TaxID=105696 RepID=A0A1Y2LW31_EPING|nr:hypothetical protein B5807_07444 [Epicoccum nigrum]